MTQPISLEIIIVSGSNELEQRMRTVPMPENIQPMIRTCCASDAAQTDILIYDAACLPSEAPGATGFLECVLYAPPGQISQGRLQNPLWTAFWPQPLSNDMLPFYLRQLLLSAQTKKECAATKSFLNTLIDSVPDLIWFKDLRGAHLKVNDAFCRAVGKTKAQCEGRGHYYIWDLKAG